MSTAAKTTTSRATKTDAIHLLMQDHKQVKALFKDYDKLVNTSAASSEKLDLAMKICAMLTAHTTVEEELFYPAARKALGKDEDLIDEASVEHASVKDLIAQIEGSSPGEALYDAKMKVMSEFIDHHVKEEETEMFPKLKKSSLDTEALGARMARRKEELLQEAGYEADAVS